MSSPADRWRFKPGDAVVDPQGNTGVVVLSAPRHSDGKQFARVRITGGARRGQTQWPDEGGWLPARDYEPRDQRFTCTSCDRDYYAPDRRGWCRTCVSQDEAAHANRKTGSRTFSRLGAAPRFQPAPVQSHATDEQRARIDGACIKSDEGVPF